MSLDELVGVLAEPIRAFGLPSPAARLQCRSAASLAELQAFHAALAPHLDWVIEALSQYSVTGIPERYRGLADAVLALYEIDDALHRWSSPRLDLASDPCTWRTKSSWYDYA